MCGAPIHSARLPRDANTAVVLCGAAPCVARHAAIPASQKCRVCTRPLAVARWAAGLCDSRSCFETWTLERPFQIARETYAESMQEAAQQRDRAAAQRGIPPEERATYRTVILPHNTDRASRLSQTRRIIFEQHLRSNLAAARARLAAGERWEPATGRNQPLPQDTRTDAERAAEAQLLLEGCAMCRGECCSHGENHAYQGVDTMMRYLHDFPDHDDEAIVTRYLVYIGARTMTNGCIYQGETGCTLPTNLRADLCNRFFCGNIHTIRHQYRAGEKVRAYFLRRRGDKLVDGRFVEIPVRELE
jgi:hypothetical protein